MVGLTFDILLRGFTFMSIFVGLLALYWSPNFFSFLRRQKKIIAFARTLPSPHTFPLIGNYQIIHHVDDILNIITQWNRDLKETFSIWIGPVPKIVTSDPRDFEIILMNSTAVEKDSDFYMMMKNLMVDTLFNGKGDAKYRARKKLLMPFTNGKYITNFTEVFNRHSKQFVKVLGDKVGKGEFDVWGSAVHCIGDILYETLFGIPGEAQYGNPDEIFLHGMERIMQLMSQRMGRIWEYYDFFYWIFNGNSREFFYTINYLQKFVKNIITEKKARYLTEKQKNIQQKDYASLCDFFIDNMMRENLWTEEELKNELLGLVPGMHDTQYGILSFVYLMLAIHPEIQEKVRKEVTDVVGDGMIDQQSIINMKYTQTVIQETIRLFPVAPVYPRRTTEKLKLETCNLPKGTSILLFAYGTHRDPTHWIDPDKFNPERFTPENSKNRHKFAFLPFSDGIRKCAGYKLGFTCLKTIVADSIRHYKFCTSLKMEDIQLHMTISVRSTNGYPISVERLN